MKLFSLFPKTLILFGCLTFTAMTYLGCSDKSQNSRSHPYAEAHQEGWPKQDRMISVKNHEGIRLLIQSHTFQNDPEITISFDKNNSLQVDKSPVASLQQPVKIDFSNQPKIFKPMILFIELADKDEFDIYCLPANETQNLKARRMESQKHHNGLSAEIKDQLICQALSLGGDLENLPSSSGKAKNTADVSSQVTKIEKNSMDQEPAVLASHLEELPPAPVEAGNKNSNSIGTTDRPIGRDQKELDDLQKQQDDSSSDSVNDSVPGEGTDHSDHEKDTQDTEDAVDDQVTDAIEITIAATSLKEIIASSTIDPPIISKGTFIGEESFLLMIPDALPLLGSATEVTAYLDLSFFSCTYYSNDRNILAFQSCSQGALANSSHLTQTVSLSLKIHSSEGDAQVIADLSAFATKEPSDSEEEPVTRFDLLIQKLSNISDRIFDFQTKSATKLERNATRFEKKVDLFNHLSEKNHAKLDKLFQNHLKKIHSYAEKWPMLSTSSKQRVIQKLRKVRSRLTDAIERSFKKQKKIHQWLDQKHEKALAVGQHILKKSSNQTKSLAIKPGRLPGLDKLGDEDQTIFLQRYQEVNDEWYASESRLIELFEHQNTDFYTMMGELPEFTVQRNLDLKPELYHHDSSKSELALIQELLLVEDLLDREAQKFSNLHRQMDTHSAQLYLKNVEQLSEILDYNLVQHQKNLARINKILDHLSLREGLKTN